MKFIADRPEYRHMTSAKAARDLVAMGVPEGEDNVDIARKVSFEGRLAAAMEYRRRIADPATMWSSLLASHA